MSFKCRNGPPPDTVLRPVPANMMAPASEPFTHVMHACTGVRRKAWQRLTLTEEFLQGAIMFAGMDSEDERLMAFGRQIYGRRLIALRPWERTRTGELKVDYFFWAYEWRHGEGCDGADHTAEVTEKLF